MIEGPEPVLTVDDLEGAEIRRPETVPLRQFDVVVTIAFNDRSPVVFNDGVASAQVCLGEDVYDDGRRQPPRLPQVQVRVAECRSQVAEWIAGPDVTPDPGGPGVHAGALDALGVLGVALPAVDVAEVAEPRGRHAEEVDIGFRLPTLSRRIEIVVVPYFEPLCQPDYGDGLVVWH